MANAAHITGSFWSRRAEASGQHQRRQSGPSFQQVLARAQWHGAAPQVAQVAPAHVTHAAARVAAPSPATTALPAAANAALTQAMARENVPASWRSGLSLIMAHESGGQVDARSPVHSARGLFQLTRANWHLNPHGAASFGNAVEEAQGGIRYIKSRYGSADRAAQFWQQHHWY